VPTLAVIQHQAGTRSSVVASAVALHSLLKSGSALVSRVKKKAVPGSNAMIQKKEQRAIVKCDCDGVSLGVLPRMDRMSGECCVSVD